MGELIPIIAILSVFVGAPMAVMWGIAQLKKADRSQAPSGDSLSADELRAMIEDAVSEATLDLGQRVERLESQVRRQRRVLTSVAGEAPEAQPARLDPDALPLADSPDDVFADAPAQREGGAREREA